MSVCHVGLAVKRQGKVRHVSISSTLPHLTTYVSWDSFDTYQIPYSALERRHEDAITAAAEKGAGVIIRRGVGQGLPSGGRAGPERWATWEKAKLDELRSSSESQIAFLLRFTITHPHMHTTIAATRNPAHFVENLKAAEAGPLPGDVYAEAKQRLSDAGERPE